MGSATQTPKNIMRKSFGERVVNLASKIPKGRVTTYGSLARAAGGGPRSAQSITSILARAYKKGKTDIPFHRIVYSDGKIWVNESHRKKRMRLYEKEGIEIDSRDRIVNFEDVVI